jgi:hypothetical protein
MHFIFYYLFNISLFPQHFDVEQNYSWVFIRVSSSSAVNFTSLTWGVKVCFPRKSSTPATVRQEGVEMHNQIYLNRKRHISFSNRYDSEMQFHAVSKMGVDPIVIINRYMY